MPDKVASDSLSQRLASGALRLRLNDGIRVGCWAALAALGVMILLVVLHRLVFLGLPAGIKALAFLGLPGWVLWTMLGLALAPLAAGAVACARSRKGPLAAALVADERLALCARISSAVCLEAAAAGSPMTPELLADARRHAALLVVRREFPLRVPRGAFWLPGGLAALGLALGLLPQCDLAGRKAKAEEVAAKKAEIAQVAEQMQKKIEELRRKPDDPLRGNDRIPSEKLADELSKLVRELREIADKEQAVEKLNKLLDETKLAEQRAAGMDKLAKQMEELGKLGKEADLPKGPAETAAAAMARSDFKAAAEELKKLAEELKAGKLSDAEKAELKRDLERLAKMTDDWKELAQELAKAAAELGAGDAGEALAEMLAAAEDLKELAELLKEYGADNAGGLGGEGARLQLTAEMIQQLKDLLKNAQRCAFCKKIYCLICGLPRCGCEGLPQCQCQAGGAPGAGGVGGLPGGMAPGAGGVGGGMGGPGVGEGGQAPENPHDVKFQATKTPGQLGKGQIIGHMWVKGQGAPKDDKMRAEYVEAHAAAAKAATEAVESGKIPRELREYVREYFTATRAGKPDGAPEAPAPGKDAPEKPAPEKKAEP